MTVSKNPRQRGRYGAAAAGLTLAVAGLATTASSVPAAGAQGDAPATAARAACTPSQLTVWWGSPGNATAGTTFFPLEFSNTTRTTCTLRGFPGVFAVNQAGGRLGSPAGRDPRFSPATVQLRPRATAHALLGVVDVGNFPAATCRPVRAAGLRVRLPHQTASTFLPLTIRACSRPGPVYLKVRTIRPGVGIPGFSQ